MKPVSHKTIGFGRAKNAYPSRLITINQLKEGMMKGFACYQMRHKDCTYESCTCECHGDTMYRRLTELNEKIEMRTPGYYVKANETVRLEWSLFGPDGKVHYTRDSFEAIEAVALK